MITHSLVANAKAVTITLMLFFTMLVSPVLAQPPTLPDGYWEDAYLGDDANVTMLLGSFENAFWQIEFHESLDDACKSAISFDAIMTIDGDVPDLPITIELNSSEWQDDFSLQVGTIKTKAGIESLSGSFHVSHIHFKLRINGTLTGHEFYPISNGWTTVPTGLSAPCNCVSIYFDKDNHKLIVGNFGC